MQMTKVLSSWQLVPLFFAQDAVAASQTATALKTTDANNSVALNVYYTMPFAGEIIGVSANLDTAGTVSTLTINPNIAGTAITDPALVISTLAYGTDTCPAARMPLPRMRRSGAKSRPRQHGTAQPQTCK